MAQSIEPIPTDKAIAGILAMLVVAREDADRETKDRPKTEVVLANAGLSPAEIAQLVDKNAGAVAKTIQRARTKPERASKDA
jgi:DNA-directed RNA polymerase specialized sigma24 family protein